MYYRILKCLRIGTPKTIIFPFVPNGKLTILGVPLFKHIIIKLQWAQILGHLKTLLFSIGTSEKFILIGVPIHKDIYGMFFGYFHISAPARIWIGQGDNARKGHFKTRSDKLGKGVGDSPPSWAVWGDRGVALKQSLWYFSEWNYCFPV